MIGYVENNYFLLFTTQSIYVTNFTFKDLLNQRKEKSEFAVNQKSHNLGRFAFFSNPFTYYRKPKTPKCFIIYWREVSSAIYGLDLCPLVISFPKSTLAQAPASS